MSARFSNWIRNSLNIAGALLIASASPLGALAMDNFEAGKVYFGKKDFRSAKMYFDKAASDMPWDSNVLYYQGLTDQYMKDFAGAKRSYHKIVEQFPGTDAERNAKAALNALEPGWERKPQSSSSSSSSGGSSSSGAPAKSASGADLPPVQVTAPAQARIPVTRTNDKVFIDVSLNGRTTKLEFAGDETSISLKDAMALQLVDKTKPPAAGTKVPVTMRMGDIVQKNFPLNIGSDTDRSKIGEDFFKQFKYTLEPSFITANHRTVSGAKGGYELPFRQQGKDIMVDVTVNGRKVSMIFDEKGAECVVPASKARDFGLDVQESSSFNTFNPVTNPNGPVRGEPGYGEMKKSASAEAKLTVGPIYNPGMHITIDETATAAKIGPSALGGWHADVDRAANVIRLTR